MARRPKNPINDIVDTVGAWFGGRGPGTNPTVSRVSRDLGRAVSAADTVTGGFGAAALRDVRNFQQGGSLPTNLAKTAAVNLAAGAVGAKAAQVAGRAIQSGRVVNPVAAARNLIKGEKVVIHGTPNQLQGRFIEPRAESYGAYDIGKPVVYNFDPRAVKAKSTIPRAVQDYAKEVRQKINPNFEPPPKSDFNAVIGRTPKSSVKTHSATGYKYSESPVSIDKVVKTDKPLEQLAVELQRELRKMGTQMRGTPVKQAVKDAKKRRQIKNRPPQPRS